MGQLKAPHTLSTPTIGAGDPLVSHKTKGSIIAGRPLFKEIFTTMRNNHVVIMAGGVGSRFWPLSTPAYPKQFIDILGCGRTLIQLTVDRFAGVAPIEYFSQRANFLSFNSMRDYRYINRLTSCTQPPNWTTLDTIATQLPDILKTYPLCVFHCPVVQETECSRTLTYSFADTLYTPEVIDLNTLREHVQDEPQRSPNNIQI